MLVPPGEGDGSVSRLDSLTEKPEDNYMESPEAGIFEKCVNGQSVSPKNELHQKERLR